MLDLSFQTPPRFFRKASCALDAQGRLAMPRIWRKTDDPEDMLFFLAPGFSNSIEVHTREGFQPTLDRLNRVPRTEIGEKYASIFTSLCQVVTLDKQGRFPIINDLLSYAQLKKQVECIGRYTYGRLLSPENWEAIQIENQPPMSTDITPEQEMAMTPEERKNLNIRRAIEFIGSL